MKFFYIAIALSITTLLPKECTGEKTQQQMDDQDSVTVTTPDVSVSDFTSNDLTFFEAHGHVKRIKTEYDDMKFDKNGNLVTVDGENPFLEHEIDGDEYLQYTRTAGLIVKEERYESTLEYVWQNGRPFNCTWVSESWIGEQAYKYDEKGLLTEMITNQQDFGEMPETITAKYKYNEFDDQRNWIKRTIYANDTIVETREIEYY